MNEESGPQARLIEAAGEVFAEHGYHAATIREITRRAGVNVAAVNYYFRDKEELYSATLLHAHKSACVLTTEDAAHLSPEERIHHFCARAAHALSRSAPAALARALMAREMANPTPMLQHLIDEVFRPKCAWLKDAIRELTGSGMDDERLGYIAASVIGHMLFYRQNRPVIQALMPDLLGRDDLIDRLARHVTDFTLAAIHNLPAMGKPTPQNERLAKTR